MKNGVHVKNPVQKAVAWLLCCVLLLSVLSFPGLNIFQTAIQSYAVAETEPVVIEPTYTYRFSQKSYEKLLKLLNVQLKKKKFSKLAKQMLRDILYYEMIYFPQWRNVYRDYPTTAAYVKENLIQVIPKISEIELIDLNTKEGKRKKKKTGWVGQTINQKGYSKITMFYDLSDGNGSAYAYEQTLATLAHEVRHVRDRDGILYTSFPTNTMENIFFEGASNFHERHVLPMATYQGAWQSVTNSKGVKILFDRETGGAYPYYQSFFDGLVYLAGYNIVDAVGEGKTPAAVKNEIANRYGQDIADSVWRILQKLPNDPKETKSPDTLFALTLKYFRLLTKCVTRDIKNLKVSQPDEIRQYMDIFRNFKNKILPYIQDKNGSFATDQYFNTQTAERLLVNKIIASGALPRLYENKALNRQAITEMLYCDEYQYRILFSREYLPPTIAQTQYTFTVNETGGEDAYEGLLTMSYKNEYDDEILLYCYFDENETTYRNAEYPWGDILDGISITVS